MAKLTKAENGVGNNNQIMNFVNDEFGSIRCIEIDNEPWFVGKDIAECLGYSNASKAVSTHVQSEDKTMIMMDLADSQNGNVPAGKTRTAFINESGVYGLIFGSKLPSARKFKRWVTSEVLPQIRRTGGYIPYKNLSEAEFVLKALEIQQATIAELRGELEASKEDVDFARCVTASSDTIDMNTMAKLLQNDGYDIGRNRLFEILRSNGILMRDNMPYQRYVENGCFEVCEHVICNVIVPQTYVTGKGQKLVYRIVGDLED